MTLNKAPWAIDGARSSAGLARLASYAGGGGRSGVIRPADLRVRALSVPGAGLRLASGGATILNRYLTSPDESYVVSNPGEHTVLEADMPSPKPSLSYYLVCIVIGDPEFDQAGHPFMPSGPLDPAVAADFEYVRVVIVPCSSGTTSFEQLGYNYPAYALARLEVPANTSTITSSMITDLRKLAQPRTHREVMMGLPPANQNLTSGSYVSWPGFTTPVQVPEWATRVVMTASIDGVWLFTGSVVGALRARFGMLAGPDLVYDVDTTNFSRHGFRLALSADVTALAGQTVTLQIDGLKNGGDTYLTTYEGGTSQVVYDVQFYEDIV